MWCEGQFSRYSDGKKFIPLTSIHTVGCTAMAHISTRSWARRVLGTSSVRSGGWTQGWTQSRRAKHTAKIPSPPGAQQACSTSWTRAGMCRVEVMPFTSTRDHKSPSSEVCPSVRSLQSVTGPAVGARVGVKQERATPRSFWMSSKTLPGLRADLPLSPNGGTLNSGSASPCVLWPVAAPHCNLQCFCVSTRAMTRGDRWPLD